MSNLNNISQKVKGKAQQIKGKIEDASGKHVKGNIDMLRGKANELGADIKGKV